MRQTSPWESQNILTVGSVDGVVVRASKPIPNASKTLNYLLRNHIPFLLLTNGGGRQESERIKEFNSKFSLEKPLNASHIVQSHSPLAKYVHPTENHKEGLKHKTVLVCGGDGENCRDVAHAYGFTSVVLPGDIYHHNPRIWPFSRHFKDYHASYAKPLPHGDKTKIDAIFVFNDPRDWGLDIQVILDLLLSHQGILGTYSSKNNDTSLPNNGYLQDGQPPLYYSNPDLLWATGYHLNRLGQGGFREALDGVWNALTGGPSRGSVLHKTLIGKPFPETYEFSERRLLHNLNEALGRKADDAGGNGGLKRVYMVGDNPDADVKGANTFRSPRGIEWISLLTRTGVYRDRPGRSPSWKPREIVDDVQAAVEWALRDSGWHEHKIS